MAEPHLPNQAAHHVIPFIKFVPQWFIDCGPGSGVEAREVRKRWPRVNLLGLEPSPIGFESASCLFPKNGNSTLLNKAVWDSDCKLNLKKPDDLLHSTFRDWETGNTIEVEARSLDSLDKELGPFDDVLLWMDIEGSEEKALRGASGLFERRVIKAVNIEVNSETAELLNGLLSQYGFDKRRTYLDQGHGGSRDELWLLQKEVV